ncbi:MAK10-like protein [Tanacetum coccineum]
MIEPPGSQPVSYYLKHKINKEIIKGLVENQRFNNYLLVTRVGKMKRKTYSELPRGPVHDAILKKKITKKEDMGGNFVIPCNVGGLKYIDALVDQGSDVNVMSLSTYNRLTDEKLVEIDIRISLASQSHIYHLGIAEDVLVEIAGFVYLVDFIILDIKEDRKNPFILGTPFLTTARAEIKFNKGTITLKSGKCKVNFHKRPELFCKFEEREDDKVDPLSIINKRILEWEERIKLHREKELEFNQWSNKLFNEKNSVSKNGRSKKAHLLGDKQIPSVGVFDEHLEDIWRKYTRLGLYFGRNGTRVQLYTKEGLKNYSLKVETASGLLGTPSGLSSDRVREFVTASGL